MNHRPKSHGRKAIRASARPEPLIDNRNDLDGVWRASVITLLPELFPGVLGGSVMGKALRDGLWQLDLTDLRDFGIGKHRNVDDTPAGGGPGMVLRPDVVAAAIDSAQHRAAGPLICLSPRGRPFDQAMARELSRGPGAVFLCGRFEGVDQRVIDQYRMIEVSLGDFVMTGGEIAAQAIIDATVRLLPGVLGNADSAQDESFSTGLLEHPQYTRPSDWRGHAIPAVLQAGHHGRVEQWRRDASVALTRERRPDLWRKYAAEESGD